MTHEGTATRAAPQVKVLLLLHTLSRSGAPKAALDALETLAPRISLQTLAWDGGPLEGRCRRLGPLDVLQERGFLGKKPSRPWVSAMLRRWAPDVIYVNSIASLNIADQVRLPDAPALLHVHELDTSFSLFVGDDRNPLLWPRRFIAVSDPVRDLLVSRYRIPTEKIRVVSASVRDDDYRETGATSERGDGPFIVGGAGVPDWRKGTTLWLQTAAILRGLASDRAFRFVWVGVRDDYAGICFREEARKLGVDDLVEWVPTTSEPLREFARFDVFAMTSWEDPCPAVVLESMMLRKPVVCFRSGGAPGQVGDTGVVLDRFSPAAMAEALAGLMASPARRERLGEAARARVGREFVASAQVPGIWAEIASLLDEARLGRPDGRAGDKSVQA